MRATLSFYFVNKIRLEFFKIIFSYSNFEFFVVYYLSTCLFERCFLTFLAVFDPMRRHAGPVSPFGRY